MADVPPLPQPPAAPAYVLQLGDTVVQEGISEVNSLIQIIHWIGFRTANQRTSLTEDSFTSFEDLRSLNDREVEKMRTDFASRTAAQGRIIFGTNKTKNIKALVHWLMDFYRVSEDPTIVGLNEYTFKDQLRRAVTRASIRKTLESQSLPDAADPGPLKSEKQWKEWEEKFVNYTRCHLGALGVPLSYVIRENDEPDTNGEHADFITKTVACAPLEGEFYDADKIAVFNMIVSFTTGQPSGDWIKSTLRYSDGRRSMTALRTHFAGEGNASRTIADADRLKESLHYKSERAMSFETFLTQLQKMFNIYENEGEEVPEEQKVRLLFKKVQHKELDSAINALKAQQTAGTVITYTMAANHLSAAVSELPEYLARSRNIAGVSSSSSGGNVDADGAYNADGSIKTGYIPNWRSLSNDDKKKVIAERKRLGINSNGKSGSSTNNTDDVSRDNTIKQLRAQNKKQKRRIKSLKRSSTSKDKEDSGKDSDDDDAGDQFGGKASKKRAKGKN